MGRKEIGLCLMGRELWNHPPVALIFSILALQNVLLAWSSIPIKAVESTSNMVARRSMAFLTPCLEEGIFQGWEICWAA